MARPQLNIPVIEVIGKQRLHASAVGARVQISKRNADGTAGALANIYGQPVSGSPLTPPFITDEVGRVAHPSSAHLYAERAEPLLAVASKGRKTWSMEVDPVSAEDLSGRELASAKRFLPSNQVGANSATWVDVLTIAEFQVQDKPIKLETGYGYLYWTGSAVGGLRVYDPDNGVVRAGPSYFGSGLMITPPAAPLDLASGTYGGWKFQVQVLFGSGYAYVVSDGSGVDPNTGQPVWMRVVEG